jgi:heme oxygenase
MTLKEKTSEKHRLAETTAFMKALFKKELPKKVWADFTYQKSLIYNGIEGVAGACGLMQDLPDIHRTHYLYKDYLELSEGTFRPPYRQVAIDYYKYILSLFPNADRIMAHVYVWHMGDLYGGQMIKKIVPGPHAGLTFKNEELLKNTIRTKLKDDMADEANIAFDWAIKLLNDYELSDME